MKKDTVLDILYDDIDRFDQEILEKIAERTQLLFEVVECKKNNPEEHVVISMEDMMEKRRAYADKLGVDRELVEHIFSLIFASGKRSVECYEEENEENSEK
jgi:chorismate mutase